MKKVLCLLLVVVLSLSLFAGCGEKKPVEPEEKGYEIAFVTDIGTIDDKSFNEGTYTGMKEWAVENGKTYTDYEPASSDHTDLVNTMETAIDNGAKVITVAGFIFAEPIAEMAEAYPDIYFIACDTSVVDANGNAFPNVATFSYKVEQAGFLAGYAVVKEGMTKIAYMGGIPFPSVYSAGQGFIQGVDAAAKEAGITVDVTYGNTGNFAPTPENKAKFSAIFADGAEVLFSFGGGNLENATSAASEANPVAWVISPDTDGTSLNETILTSVMKELGFSAYSALEDWATNEGKKYFGVNSIVDLEDGMVGLPFDNSRFENFTEADYEAAKALVKANGVNIVDEDKVGIANVAKELGLNNINFKTIA